MNGRGRHLRGEDGALSTRPICVIGLDFVDEWEARRAGNVRQ
jgi:hypothetical protein